MNNLSITVHVQNFIRKFFKLTELLIVEIFYSKNRKTVIINSHYGRCYSSHSVDVNVMPTDAKFHLFCCIAVNQHSHMVTFTALFSFIMECFALGTTLYGTLRLYTVGIVLC